VRDVEVQRRRERSVKEEQIAVTPDWFEPL
jgi:hypothetical protein